MYPLITSSSFVVRIVIGTTKIYIYIIFVFSYQTDHRIILPAGLTLRVSLTTQFKNSKELI